jgi:hypothetical protein
LATKELTLSRTQLLLWNLIGMTSQKVLQIGVTRHVKKVLGGDHYQRVLQYFFQCAAQEGLHIVEGGRQCACRVTLFMTTGMHAAIDW